jgi:lysylphosphatidylglycerol synthetase-like protein (DUF2156 family)
MNDREPLSWHMAEGVGNRLKKNWDVCLFALSFLSTALWSLLRLIDAGGSTVHPTLNFFIKLLLIEAVVGTLAVLFGVLTRYYRVGQVGWFITHVSLAEEFVLSFGDGFTPRDMTWLMLLFAAVCVYRLRASRLRTVNEVLTIRQQAQSTVNKFRNDTGDAR